MDEMKSRVRLDRTSSGKENFEVLDVGMIRICKFSGRLSYPLHITHIPFVYVLANFAWTRNPSANLKLAWIFVLIPFVILVAWLALKLYDEPIRARLTRRYGIRWAEA